MKRKNLKARAESLDIMTTSLSRMQEEAALCNSQQQLDAALVQLRDMQQKMIQTIAKLPTGHRYTGTFYLKVPYSEPTEYKEINGSIFMREDLVSWEVEDNKGFPNQAYYRYVYKAPFTEKLFKREDALPVYDQKHIEEAAVI